jgi:CheY-like chemotaxis protein
MPAQQNNERIIIADPNSFTRSLVSEVLRPAGYSKIRHASDGNDLLRITEEYAPKIVITTSRLPVLSGLEFTRLIRAGHRSVPRQLGIITMTDSPTESLLDAARESGVDEMLVQPFTTNAVLVRIRSVLERPRPFVESKNYVGPSRRRRMAADYVGPKRRLVDPVEKAAGALPWESDCHRAMARICVQTISDLVSGLTPGDPRGLREVYAAIKATETIADGAKDVLLAAAVRSLGRYVMAVGGAGGLDAEAVHAHIGAMNQLVMLAGTRRGERETLVDGLTRVVDKKLRIAG